MSKSKVLHTKIHPEPRKFPFDQTFLCPKCSEILFVKIYYIESTIIPQVKYICPKRHSGSVDLSLFFNLFHSSYQDIEDELSKFDENLEKDIETFKAKKMKDRKILDPINFAEIMNKKNKEEGKKQEKEKMNGIQNKEEIKKSNEDNENNQLFKEIKKCNEIKFSLLNIKKEIKEPKILEKQYSKSETKNKEKIEDKSPEIKNQIKKSNKNNKNSFSPKTKINNINNINIIKKRNSNSEDIKEEEKEKKEESKKKEKKETKEEKEDKFVCSLHGNRFTGYCFSCKKNMCKKCFKKKGHKKRKIFSNVVLNEKNLTELNKALNQCQERLNKFENKVHSLIEELSNKEKNEKMILNIMSKAYIDINRENLKEIKDLIKIYVNCVKKGMLNYETIMNVKNLNIKNVILIPNNIVELIQILRTYKNFIIQKNINKKGIILNDEKSKENKYVQLFNTFFELLKKYENENINFKEIVEDENFRKIISSNDYGNIEMNKKEENKITTTEEKEINEIEKMEECDMNYLDDGYDNYEEYLEEEDENEIEYEDDYDDYNVEDIEDEYNYVLNENMRMEQHEHENKECQ